jgi:YVTN family beta-propeller protein
LCQLIEEQTVDTLTNVLAVAGVATLTLTAGSAPVTASQPPWTLHAAGCLAGSAAASSLRNGSLDQTVLGEPCDRLYAVNNQSSDGRRWTVSVIDPRSERVVEEVPVGPEPHHIYPVPGRNVAYISHLTGNVLDVLDLVSNRVVGQVVTGSGPRHLEFSPDGRVAYTDDLPGNTITAVDTASGRTLGIVPVGRQPNYNVTSADGRYIFVADSGESAVSVVDARSLRVVRTVTVGLRPAATPSHPFDLVLTPDGAQVVVAGAGDNSLSFVDARTLTETASVPIGGPNVTVPGQGQPQKLNVRLTPDGRLAWVGNQANSEWSVVSVDAHRLVSEIPAGLGADILFQPPAGPAAGFGIGTARYSDHMTVVDARHPSLVRAVATALGSHIVVFNRDWTTGFVACRPGNAVSVVDLRSMTDVRDIPVGLFPDGLVYIWFEHGRAQTHSA